MAIYRLFGGVIKKSQKFFEKISKKGLTNAKTCDII